MPASAARGYGPCNSLSPGTFTPAVHGIYGISEKVAGMARGFLCVLPGDSGRNILRNSHVYLQASQEQAALPDLF